MQLERWGVKVFCEDGEAIDLLEFIPVFHRWIQCKTGDELLIDVADYSHVADGPGVLLAAHAGNYSIDESSGRRGLVYYNKVVSGQDSAQALANTVCKALAAAERLEREPEFSRRLSFRGDQLLLFANDRLAAPNTDEVYESLSSTIDGLCDRLFGADTCSCVREGDPRERLAVSIQSTQAIGLAALLERAAA